MSRIADAFERSSAERGTTALSRSSPVPIPWPLESSLSAPDLSRELEPGVNIDTLPNGPVWPRDAGAPHGEVSEWTTTSTIERPEETRPSVAPAPSLRERSSPARPGGAATPRTVADLLSTGSRRSWQEAVSIVQSAAAALRPGWTLPPPEDICFDATGAIAFESRNDSGEDPVASLAVLLVWLLDGTDAPPGLMQLARENATAAPRLTTVQALSSELAQYEQVVSSHQLFDSNDRIHTRATAFARLWMRARRAFRLSR